MVGQVQEGEVVELHQVQEVVVEQQLEIQQLGSLVWGHLQLVAQLDDLCIYHWLFILIISAPYQERDDVQQCTRSPGGAGGGGGEDAAAAVSRCGGSGFPGAGGILTCS